MGNKSYKFDEDPIMKSDEQFWGVINGFGVQVMSITI